MLSLLHKRGLVLCQGKPIARLPCRWNTSNIDNVLCTWKQKPTGISTQEYDFIKYETLRQFVMVEPNGWKQCGYYASVKDSCQKQKERLIKMQLLLRDHPEMSRICMDPDRSFGELVADAIKDCQTYLEEYQIREDYQIHKCLLSDITAQMKVELEKAIAAYGEHHSNKKDYSLC